jgi:YD repeat-containing protein
MRALMLWATTCFATAAFADSFPWADGTTTLTTDGGKKMTWALKRENGVVLISATHPDWSFEHRSQPDGTPLSTVKKKDGKTTRLTYGSAGAEVERTDARGNVSKVTIKQSGLWDSDSLDARLAGIAWAKGKKVRFHLVDVDAADGSVYPMVAEYVEEKTCGDVKCHRVRLALDDFRRVFAPTFEYFFSVEGGARYLRHEGDGYVFVAK